MHDVTHFGKGSAISMSSSAHIVQFIYLRRGLVATAHTHTVLIRAGCTNRWYTVNLLVNLRMVKSIVNPFFKLNQQLVQSALIAIIVYRWPFLRVFYLLK